MLCKYGARDKVIIPNKFNKVMKVWCKAFDIMTHFIEQTMKPSRVSIAKIGTGFFSHICVNSSNQMLFPFP